MKRWAVVLSVGLLVGVGGFRQTRCRAEELQPIPNGLVVLTFDDGNVSDYTFTAPILRGYGFGATFYIASNCGWLGIPGVDDWRLTWAQIKSLEDDGFEIGNHTASHPNLVPLSKEQVRAEVEQMEQACADHNITAPNTFCYPGYDYDQDCIDVLQEKGYLFARRGVAPEFPASDNGDRGPVYDPDIHHPLLLPTTFASGPNMDITDFIWAVEQARDGKIAVLTFHGVPDVYPHCSTPPATFESYMEYLHNQGYTVISMQDLANYIDPYATPEPTATPTPPPPTTTGGTYTETFDGTETDLGLASGPTELYKWFVSPGYTLNGTGAMVDDQLLPGSLVMRIPGDVDFTMEGTMILPNGMPPGQTDMCIRDNDSDDSLDPYTGDPFYSAMIYNDGFGTYIPYSHEGLFPTMSGSGYIYNPFSTTTSTTPITYRVKIDWNETTQTANIWYSLDGSAPTIAGDNNPHTLSSFTFNNYNNMKEVGFMTWQVGSGSDWTGFPVHYDYFTVTTVPNNAEISSWRTY